MGDNSHDPNPKQEAISVGALLHANLVTSRCRKFIQAQAPDKGKPKCSQGKKQFNQDAMLISHALSAGSSRNWVVNSGATCHMSNDRSLFAEMRELPLSEKVTLGDGHKCRCFCLMGTEVAHFRRCCLCLVSWHTTWSAAYILLRRRGHASSTTIEFFYF